MNFDIPRLAIARLKEETSLTIGGGIALALLIVAIFAAVLGIITAGNIIQQTAIAAIAVVVEIPLCMWVGVGRSRDYIVYRTADRSQE
jgi:hypothetical protein